MKQRTRATVAVASFVLLAGWMFGGPVGAAQAHMMGPGGGGHGGGRGHGPGSLVPLRLLIPRGSLNPDQEQQVRTIMESNHDTMRQLHQQLKAARTDLTTKFLTAGPLDAAALAPLQQKIAQVRQQLEQQQLTTALAVRNVLTADQLAAAAARRDRFQALKAEMHQLFGGQK